VAGNSPQRIGYHDGASELNNVIAFLERHRRDRPEKTALMWSAAGAGDDPTVHDSMSCAQLAARVESAAAGLSRLGLSAGDRVFIFVPMSPQLYVAMFAVQRLGAAAVFLDSWARRGQLGSCAAQVEPRGFIGPEAAFALTSGVPELESAGVRVVVGPHDGKYSASLEELAAAGESCPVRPVEREHTALITFTTGSSGPPKGADRTHRFLAAQHEALDRCLPYADDDVDLPVFPIFSLNNIAGGVTTVLPAVDLARPSEADGRRLLAQIEAAGVTCSTLSPWLLRAAAAAGEDGAAMRGVRRIATGGAPISADDVAAVKRAAPNAGLHILYGSTEVEPIAHLVAAEMPAAGEGGGVCVGTLAAGLEHRLIRISREPVKLGSGGWSEWEVPDDRPGELVVAGEHVCANYYRNDEAFRRAKIVDGGRVWHRTGDVCRFGSGGRLWVEGRVHSAICRSGETLLPVGPEIVMKRLPFVRAAAYLGLPDEELGERAAAVFAAGPESGSGGDLRGELRAALEAAGVIVDDVIQVEEIPLDPRHHSKVEYAVLRQRILERRAGR
jgi:acyl-coenzyme A synthetase/AMP-(fatty) acid ligase